MDSSFQQIVSYEKNEKQLISNFQQEDIIAHILISPLGNAARMQQPSCNHEHVITSEPQRKTAAWNFDGTVVPPTCPSASTCSLVIFGSYNEEVNGKLQPKGGFMKR
ncbi:uncharacterized protein LOC118524501 [Halichoerus grypus]